MLKHDSWDNSIAILGETCDQQGRKPFVLDIGANDGYFQSAFYHVIVNWGWGGLMIEPVFRNYKKLSELYKDNPRATCIRCAIGNTQGHLSMKVPPDGSSDVEWSSSTASSNYEERVVKHSWGTELVQCFRIQQVLNLFAIMQIDAVNIDTEGMDLDVLKQLDLVLYRPTLIKWEVCHMSESQLSESVEFVKSHGYGVYPIISGDSGKPFDMVAYLEK